ncbi:MAG: TonB-dependent receptor [Bacteroidales bacterium]|nr:TonB-dependent receptor [Bacteroidales bacterium]
MRHNFTLRLFAFFALTVSTFSMWAQNVTLSGTIKDDSNGETLLGVYILLSDTMHHKVVDGCVTNQAGFYSITVPAGVYEVSVNYMSYKEQKTVMDLRKSQRYDIDLVPDAILGEEVVIKGERTNNNVESADVGRMEMKIETIKALPALMGEADIIRSIQLLPGVQSGGEGNSGYYVRGGGTDQNLIMLDEATIYNCGHLFGFFSIFNADAVKNIEMIKSGMPANYGGRAASILNVTQKEGNMKRFEVDGGIGLIFSHLTLQGPFKKDKASFLISARRTYADLIIQPFLKPTSPLKGMGFYFYDLNAKFNVVINNKHRLYFGAYYGNDHYGFQSNSQQTKAIFVWRNAAASARWNYIISNKLFLNTSATFSYYDFGTEMRLDVYEFKLNSGIRDYTLKSELTILPIPKVTIKTGVHNIFHVCHPGQYAVQAGTGFDFSLPKVQPYLANEFSLYAHTEYDPTPWLKLNMGVRYTNFTHLGAFTRYVLDDLGYVADSIIYRPGQTISQYNKVEPRFSARFLLDSLTSIKVSATLNYQFLHQISIASITLPTDVWMPSTDILKPQRVWQYSLGVFRNFHQNMFEAYIDLYFKQMYNLAEYRDGLDFSFVTINPDQLYVFGKGWATGAEFFVRKTRGRFTGFIGYTLGFTRRQFDDLNNGEPFWAKYDRRHDVSISLCYEIIRNKLSVSALWVYQTGNTMTIPIGYYFYMGSYITEYSGRNEFRIKPYHRLDISLDWTIKKTRKWETGLNFSIYNVYNRKNPFFIFFETRTNADFSPENPNFSLETQAYQMSLFPIIPSITWNFKF